MSTFTTATTATATAAGTAAASSQLARKPLDAYLSAADLALRTLFAPAHSSRPPEAAQTPTAPLNATEQQAVARMMRVNHTGEICAQALYSGQALATQNATLRGHLVQAGQEEMDHLAWTERRLTQLHARPSVFNPLWYAGAFAIGYGAAKLGDDWSLGFVAETEHQVGAHLQSHIERLPEQDAHSRLILQQMQREELEHREHAQALGARDLPHPIKTAMRAAAKVMTSIVARV
ncbi:MAG: 2-polyprenyl-3-methyl-6-methoxy-1,4-benzoquinone monooxygenase [Brachymonas sp.]|jgi:ubiquinone biosynthesis monooxygenase Coq7